MWSRLDSPIGPRASSSVSVIPKVANASTKICVGASEPWSTSVPAQSKITACRRGWRRAWAVVVLDAAWLVESVETGVAIETSFMRGPG